MTQEPVLYNDIPKTCDKCGGKMRIYARNLKTKGEKVDIVVTVVTAFLAFAGGSVIEIACAGTWHFYLWPLLALLLGAAMYKWATNKPKLYKTRCMKCKGTAEYLVVKGKTQSGEEKEIQEEFEKNSW